jgi:FKBP-type peptidyl-prolyl cis-trans isomerase
MRGVGVGHARWREGEEITLGTGELAARGTVVTIHYRGFLRRGDLLRSS